MVLRAGELSVRSDLRAQVMRATDVQAVTYERFLDSRTVKLSLADGIYDRAAVAGRTRGLFRQNVIATST